MSSVKTQVGARDLATETRFEPSAGITATNVQQAIEAAALSSEASWGDINGTLANQTDLQLALDAKLAVTTAAATYQPLDADLTSWAGVTRAAGLDTFAASPSSANLAALVTGETGTGALVFADTATLIAPTLGVATATSVSVGDDAYAVGWNGSTLVPTKNAVYDKIELVLSTTLPAAYQPLDGELTALAGLTSAADALPYFTGAGTASTTTVTSFARSILDDANEATFKATVNLEIGTDVQAQDATLQSLSALGTTADRIAYTTALDTWAETPLTSYGRSLIDDADASAARTTLGLVIGTNVQAYDGELAALAGLTSAADSAPYFTGSGTAALMTVTAAARTVLDDTTTGAMLTTLGAQPTDATLTALAAYSTNGLLTQTAADTFTGRTLTGTAAEITVTNGDGVSGNPTLSIPSAVTLTGKTLTGGTFASPALSGTADVQQAMVWSGDISPTQITADQNDYAPTGFSTATVLRLNSDASRNITGLAGGADGRVILVHNVGSFAIVLVDESASSTAGNRFALSANVSLAADSSTMLQYDATSSRWRVIGGTGSGGGGGDALVANPLSQFAATTSSQLAGVISDETGTGALVFGTGPTFSSTVAATATDTHTNTTDNATVATAVFQGDRATMAANDSAYIDLRLSDSAGNQDPFARIKWQGTTVTSTSEVGKLLFGIGTGGTIADEVELTATALSPVADGGSSLGTTALGWQNLFGNTGFVWNIEGGNWVATHTTGILTVGTGDLRVTTAGTNTASVVTVGGTQTLTAKTLTSPTLTTPVLGTPSSGTLTSCTGLPLTTGVTGTLPVANGGTGQTTEAEAVGELIQALTADATPDWSADYIATYDASADTGKKVLLSVASREKLAASRTYYVRTDGSDSNTGLVDSSGGAFLTIQKAIDTACGLDLSIYGVTIDVGNGTYTGANTLKPYIGTGPITILGDTTTPSNVVINVSGICFTSEGAPLYSLRGMRIQGGTGSVGILATKGALVNFDLCDFGTITSGQHIFSQTYALVTAAGNYSISGGAGIHWIADTGDIDPQARTVTITGTPAFSTVFAYARAGRIFAAGMTFSGSATGMRYLIERLGVISTNAGGASYLPGNSAGSGGTTTGGGIYD